MADDALDVGSDLSELSDIGSQPATPGPALTPGASPVYVARLEASTSTTTQRNNARSSRRDSARLNNVSPPPDNLAANEPAKQGRRASKRWEFSVEPHRNVFEEPPAEGKRQRKQVERYGQQAGQQSTGSSRRGSTSKVKSGASVSGRGSASRSPDTTKASLPPSSREGSEAVESADRTKGRKKLSLKLKRKGVTSTNVDNTDVHAKSGSEDDEDEDEIVQHASKRRRKSAAAPSKSEEDVNMQDATTAQEEVAFSSSERRVKNGRGGKGRFSLNRRGGHRVSESMVKMQDVAQSDDEQEEDWDAEEDEAESELEDLSDDEDVLKAKGEKVKKITSKLGKKGNASKQDKVSKTTKAKGGAKQAAKPAAEVIPVRDLSAGVAFASATSTSAPSIARPVQPRNSQPGSDSPAVSSQNSQPQPKAATVRKPQSSSVFSSLLGLGGASGSASRTGTPTRPRPPGSAASASPAARQAMAAKAGGIPDNSGKAAKSVLPRPNGIIQATNSYGGIKNSVSGTQSRQDNPGLEGKHVTAEQMAEERVKQLHANANPRNLFDLLEGAELMMEFEDETRQRLKTDAILHRYKLYRPGRTEGIWKLAERIKDGQKADAGGGGVQ